MTQFSTFVWETGATDADGDLGFSNGTAVYNVTYNGDVIFDDGSGSGPTGDKTLDQGDTVSLDGGATFHTVTDIIRFRAELYDGPNETGNNLFTSTGNAEQIYIISIDVNGTNEIIIAPSLALLAGGGTAVDPEDVASVDGTVSLQVNPSAGLPFSDITDLADPLNDIVEGTTGDDTIDGAYTDDPEGDRVDNNDATGDFGETAGSNDDSIFGDAGNDSIVAGDGNDTVDGGDDNDTIDGGVGNDSLTGGSGDDVFVGIDGTDALVGGEAGETGGDTLDLTGETAGATVTLTGDEAGTATNADGTVTFSEIENIDLTDQNDTFDGSAAVVGANVSAGGGDDSLLGGTGNDTIDGGADNDTIDGGVGNDSITGGTGDDSLTGGDGSDTIDGGEGNDTLIGGAQGDNLIGGLGNDSIADDGNGGNTIDAGDGNDTITIGGNSNNTITAGDGDDSITYFASSNTRRAIIDAGDGNDTITATANGRLNATGGTGDDSIRGSNQNDTIDGGADNDTINGGNGNDNLTGGDGDDVFVGIAGTDTVVGGEGGETNGDTLNLTGETAGVTVTLTGAEQGTATNADGTVNFSEIELFELTDQDDTFDGSGSGTGTSVAAGAGNDSVVGTGGADTIDGGADNDTIDGGGGDDSLTGGDGDDLFVFGSGSGDDTISDFGTGDDTVDLSDIYDAAGLAAVNSAGGGGGPFSSEFEMLQADAADGVIDGVIGGKDFKSDLGLGVNDALTLTGSPTLTSNNTNVVCFTSEVLIATAMGQKPAGELEVGDLVQTLDHGYQPIQWIGKRRIDSDAQIENPNLRPFRIKAGALGCGLPQRDLMLSRQHRVLLSNAVAERIFGCREVLVPVKDLEAIPGIDVVESHAPVTYVHFLFGRHEIVFAEGAPMESLLPGLEALKTLDPSAFVEIQRLYPQLFMKKVSVDDLSARNLACGRKARHMVDRTLKNDHEVSQTLDPTSVPESVPRQDLAV